MVAAPERNIRGPIWDVLFKPYSRGEWDKIPRQILIEGTRGSGKSFPIGLFLDTVARDFPGCRILVVRRTRVSLTQSWMVTFEQGVLHPRDPIKVGATRAHRQSYQYANGSEIVVGGMDNPLRILSTEYDIAYCNEGLEFTEEQITDIHGVLRNGKVPFQMLIADCNPGSEFHWLNQAAEPHGPMPRIITRMWHNPRFWAQDEDGNWGYTPDGLNYKEQLELIPGVNYLRYVKGQWVTAEGVIIPLQPDVHVVDARVEFPAGQRPWIHVEGWDEPLEVGFFCGAVDHGFRNPGTFQVWAVTMPWKGARRRFLVREVYQTGRDEDWWADQMLELDRTFKFHRIVCDSADPARISKFNRVLWEARDRRGSQQDLVCIPARKSSTTGKTWLELQAVLMREGFLVRPDGTSLSYVFSNSLTGPADGSLARKPKRLVEEASGWTYEKYDAAKHRGLPKEVGDPDLPNHAIDAASYFFEWVELHDLPEDISDLWPEQYIDNSRFVNLGNGIYQELKWAK